MQHESIFGVKTQTVSLLMIAIGLLLCVAFIRDESVFLAQFGVISIFIGVDMALTLRERARRGGERL